MKTMFLFTFLASLFCHADIVRVGPSSVQKVSKISVTHHQVQTSPSSWSYHEIIEFQVKLKDKEPLKFCFKYLNHAGIITFYSDVENFVKVLYRSSQQLTKSSLPDKNLCTVENMNIIWTPSELDPTCSEPKFFLDEVAVNCN